MAQLDVNDVMVDPDLCTTFDVVRQQESVGFETGRTIITEQKFPGQVGVITWDEGKIDQRDDAVIARQAIRIACPFSLRDASFGYQPDIVIWQGTEYRITSIKAHRHLGRGWTHATGESVRGSDNPPWKGKHCMIALDSSTKGYLRSTKSSPYGIELEDIFHDVIQGITGIEGNMVRPKHQVNPSTMPGFDVDWISFSVYVEPTNWNAYKTLVDDLTYTVEGSEVLRVTCSFWGPDYQELERSWRDGIQLGQNRDELLVNEIQFEQFADPVTVPLLMKEHWVKHMDLRGTFHRWARREYKVYSLLSANGTIHADQTPAGEVIGTFQTDPPPT